MKLKKIFVIVFSVIFLLLISQQLYYRFDNRGNLIFFISHMRSLDTPIPSYEIYLDGEKVSGGMLNEVYESVVLKTSLKNHTAVIKINGEVSNEIKFNTILVTFILVDYRGEDKEEPFSIKIKKHHLFFLS